MLELYIQNFRKIRDLHLQDKSKVSVIVGYNEAGKSSLVNAIKFAFVGEAYGHSGKNVQALVSHGEKSLAVKVRCGPHAAARTTTTGDSLASIAERFAMPKELLPLLFDARLNGDGGNKHMKAFLNGVAASRFDPAVHFVNDPAVKYYVDQAKRAGNETVRKIVAYCEAMRAAQKAPAEPVLPQGMKPTDEQIKALDDAVTAAAEELTKAENAHGEIVRMGRHLLQIVQFVRDTEAFEKLRQAASAIDPLKDKRRAFTALASGNLATFDAWTRMLTEAGFGDTAEAKAIADAKTAAAALIALMKQHLDANPPPPGMPQTPILPEEAKAMHDDLASRNELTEAKINEYSGFATIEGERLRNLRDAASRALTQHKEALAAAQRTRGAWDEYERAKPQWEESKTRIESEWNRWDHAAKEILRAETEHNEKAGDAFGKMVSEFGASILQGRHLRVSPEDGITLGDEKVDDLSESTRWRVEVAVMAAVAHTLRSPLLLIDGADILDERNRAAINKFLFDRIVPHFEHVILTLTPRGNLSEEKPSENPQATKYIIDNGELRLIDTKIQATATI